MEKQNITPVKEHENYAWNDQTKNRLLLQQAVKERERLRLESSSWARLYYPIFFTNMDKSKINEKEIGLFSISNTMKLRLSFKILMIRHRGL
ncbi:hypothetical protein [Siminovitchia sp. 179-K 8D1 HS]|uniref:hypothetical protein n=1 Tax=Siminovitchia sp. 179-K 8D1 HS TaxID=3142385 RepID=UPI0039A33F45